MTLRAGTQSVKLSNHCHINTKKKILGFTFNVFYYISHRFRNAKTKILCQIDKVVMYRHLCHTHPGQPHIVIFF